MLTIPRRALRRSKQMFTRLINPTEQRAHRIPAIQSMICSFPTSSLLISDSAAPCRHFATSKKNATKAKPVSGESGRVLLKESGVSKKKGKGGARLCSGCGAEVTASGGRDETSFVTGSDAVDDSLSRNKAKKARYFDPIDNANQSAFLCERCKALKKGNLWKAYDALRDVSPDVFRHQLQHIVSRRRFGMALVVVDSTDAEHSVVKNLRRSIGKTPAWLVLNKVDLLPRVTRFDIRNLAKRVERTSGIPFAQVFAVSAKENSGIIDLSERLLQNLQGRDVFVLGSANVGKSTLVHRLSSTIASAVYMKGQRGAKRRDIVSNLNVTGSHLPGTTLQAVRIPCFSSSGHALWDTPGIINPRALQYSIFPSHLMEPLTRPEPIPIPTRQGGRELQLREGHSILVEAPWMIENDKDDAEKLVKEKPCTLARIDLVGVEKADNVSVQAFLHPSLNVRVVPIPEAPKRATIPLSHIKCISALMGKSTKESRHFAETYSTPLLPFVTKDLPNGIVVPGEKEWSSSIQKYTMDIVYPSLGWLAFRHSHGFRVMPHSVEGSVFSKRLSLYPFNLCSSIENYGDGHLEPDILDDESKRRIQDAARSGRHQSKRNDHHDEDEFYGYDEYESW